jgi:tetratricopeptide (TPR) repeat protein
MAAKQPFTAIVLLTAAVLLTPHVAGQENRDFEEAFREGTKLLADMQFAAALAPLEKALKLAPDDAARLRVYERLLQPYRQLPEIDKMVEAQEFIIAKSERRPARARASRELANFLHQRGKTDESIARYDARLKADPKDVAALSVLETILTKVKRDRQRGPGLTERLGILDRELAAKLAARLEEDAKAAPQTAATIYKDAASAWLEADEKAKAVAAAQKSLVCLPEERSDLLAFYWRNGLGEVFLAAGEPTQAIGQFEAALKVVTVEGYRKDTEKKLAEAKAAAAKQP